MDRKLLWQGAIQSVQPRIRMLRSFDERSHTYLGYVLRIQGAIAGQCGEFWIAVGKATHAKHQFRVGDEIQGKSVPVSDSRLETADYYKTSGVQILWRNEKPEDQGPPWLGVAPELEVYRQRGHRRLHPVTYEKKCSQCIWGCRMPVVIIVDHWNPDRKRFRYETFCYGPKSCPFYRAGATRKVPGRRGLTWEEEDWVDEEATEHRGWDE